MMLVVLKARVSLFRLIGSYPNRLFARDVSRLLISIALAGLFAVAGCDRPMPEPDVSEAGGSGSNVSENAQAAELQVRQRAQQRWAALVARDFAAAYAYETPGYRSTVSPEQFQSRFGAAVRWRGATVEAVAIDAAGDRAEVTIQLDYEAPDALGGLYTNRKAMRERWIASEGTWWYVRD